MICHRIGRPPISTIGFGRMTVSSLRRVPAPPASNTAFIEVAYIRNHANSTSFSAGLMIHQSNSSHLLLWQSYNQLYRQQCYLNAFP
jgi:hypothetical protein